MENLFWLGVVGALVALLFAYSQARRVKKFSEGTPTMEKIAAAIRKGANAYLKRQYKTVAIIFAIIAVILAVLAYVPWIDGEGLVNKFVPFAFVTGGFYSCMAGFVGMRIATSANARTANAASESLNRGLRVAISSGSVMGFTVVGLGILDVSVWFLILEYGFHCDAETIANTMVMFGMGASCAALFARVGGGIFTTSAPTWSARSRRASPRTTRATRPQSRTTSATTSATSRAWARTSTRATSAPSSPPLPSAPPRATAGTACSCPWPSPSSASSARS